MRSSKFFTDIEAIRDHASHHITQGAVTDGYQADREVVLDLLNQALATEILCVLRYKQHYYMAKGPNAQSAAAEFAEHALEEQIHVDQIAQRIVQLNGKPNFNPDGLSQRSHSQFVEGDSLLSMERADLIAERIAIDSYREMISYIGEKDPTTRRMLESILAMEEQHAEDLVNLISVMEPEPVV